MDAIEASNLIFCPGVPPLASLEPLDRPGRIVLPEFHIDRMVEKLADHPQQEIRSAGRVSLFSYDLLDVYATEIRHNALTMFFAEPLDHGPIDILSCVAQVAEGRRLVPAHHHRVDRSRPGLRCPDACWRALAGNRGLIASDEFIGAVVRTQFTRE